MVPARFSANDESPSAASGDCRLAGVNFDQSIEFRLVQTAPSPLDRKRFGLRNRFRSILQ